MKDATSSPFSEFDIHCACLSQDHNFISNIIASGIDLNALRIHGNPILNFACVGGNLDIVKLLVEHGCNINATNEHGSAALSNAYTGRHLDIAAYLIEKGADVKLAAKGDADTLRYFQALKEDISLKKSTSRIRKSNSLGM